MDDATVITTERDLGDGRVAIDVHGPDGSIQTVCGTEQDAMRAAFKLVVAALGAEPA